MKLGSILPQIEVRPRAIIVLGPPKCGKTEWLTEYAERNKIHNYINLNIGAFNNTEERSVMLSSCLENKESFIYEGIVLKEDRIMNLIDKIRKNGYQVCLAHVNKSLEELIIENDDKEFEPKLIELHRKSRDIFSRIKDKFDKVIEVK